MSTEPTWRLTSRRKARGTYWILECGRADEREHLALGYGTEEEFAPVLRGMNALAKLRGYLAEQRVPLPPDPGSPRAPLLAPLPGAGFSMGGWDPTHGQLAGLCSPQYLLRVVKTADEDTREQEKQRVVNFLVRVGEAFPPGGNGGPAMTPEDLSGLARAAGLGINASVLPLRQYVEMAWAPIRSQDAGNWRKEKGLLDRHVLPKIGHVAMSDLDARDVFACIKGATKLDGAEAAHDTKRLIKAALSVMFTHAYEAKHRKTPWSWGGLRLTGSKVKPLRQTALDVEAVVAIVAACETARDRALLAVGFSLATRPEELVALRWEDVVWAASATNPAGQIHVRGTKTEESDRLLPLVPLGRDALREHWMACGQPKEGTIFLTRRGTPYATGDGASYYRKMLRSAADRAGLTGVRITPYTLRHTRLTLLRRAGITPDVTRAFAGHRKDSRTLENHYDKTTAADLVKGREMPDLVSSAAVE